MAENTVELVLKAKDLASAEIERVMAGIGKSRTKTEQQAQNQNQKTTAEQGKNAKRRQKVAEQAHKHITDLAKQSERTQQQENNKTTEVVKQNNFKKERATRVLAESSKRLGIRTERAIQAELLRSERAYQKLARSGKVSARNLNRAFSQHKAHIKALNAEMGKLGFGGRAMAIGRGITTVGAGFATGAAVMAQPIKRTADYKLELAYLANTAFSDRDLAGRKAGMVQLQASIEKALQYGGNKETVLAALNTLIAKGRVSVDTAMEVLPTIQKNAIATHTDALDMAELVNAGLGYGIKESQVQDFIDYANAAGKAGGFELNAMAKYAPSLFAAAKGAGLSGMSGAKEMFRILQQVYNVSGGDSETATNTLGFLSKLNSTDTVARAKRIEYTDPKDGNVKGIDLEASMTNYMKKGLSSVEAFLTIVDEVMASDKEYQKLQQALKNAKNDSDRKMILHRVADYLEGTKIGQFIGDRNATLGMYGVRSQTETEHNVNEEYERAIGGTEQDSQFIQRQAKIKFDRATNAKEIGEIKAFDKLTDVTGDLADKLVDYANEYPSLTMALAGATQAVKALGAAAIATSAVMMLSGKNPMGLLKGGGKAVNTLRSKIPFFSGKGRFIPTPLKPSLAQTGAKWGVRLAKAGVLLEAMTHSTTLNEGENEWLAQREQALMKNGETLGRLDVAPSKPQGMLPEIRVNEQRERDSEIATLSQTIGNYLDNVAKNYTLKNQITLQLDGRVVADTVSEYLFDEMIRG